MRFLTRRVARLEWDVFGIFTREQFEATRVVWAELKWRTLEALGVEAATCSMALDLHAQSVEAALCHTRFPLQTPVSMAALVDRIDVAWERKVSPLLTTEQNARFADVFWQMYTELAETGQLQTLGEAWEERRQRAES
jgi:hypothetical protein